MTANETEQNPRGREVNADPITGEPGAHPVGSGVGAFIHFVCDRVDFDVYLHVNLRLTIPAVALRCIGIFNG